MRQTSAWEPDPPAPCGEAAGAVAAEEAPAVRAFLDKMQTAAAQAIYRLRGAIAEFPNAWIKEKFGLRRFHVRGRAKALCEMLWACLTYNIQQWIRLRWRKERAAAAS